MSLLLLFQTKLVTANLAATEADDTLSSTAAVLIQGIAGITEAGDTLASTATVLAQTSATITEDDDTLAATATVPVIEVVVPVVEVGGGAGVAPSRRRIRNLLQEIDHEQPRIAALSVTSIDTLSATALVGGAALLANRGVTAAISGQYNDDEEAIMVLLLAA